MWLFLSSLHLQSGVNSQPQQAPFHSLRTPCRLPRSRNWRRRESDRHKRRWNWRHLPPSYSHSHDSLLNCILCHLSSWPFLNWYRYENGDVINFSGFIYDTHHRFIHSFTSCSKDDWSRNSKGTSRSSSNLRRNSPAGGTLPNSRLLPNPCWRFREKKRSRWSRVKSSSSSSNNNWHHSRRRSSPRQSHSKSAHRTEPWVMFVFRIWRSYSMSVWSC